MGQESRHGSAEHLWCRISRGLQFRCQPELWSPIRGQRGQDLPLGKNEWLWADVINELLDRGPQLLTGCWLEASVSSLPCGILFRVAHTWQAHVCNETEAGEGLRNLILKALPPRFLPHSLHWKQAMRSNHTREEGITQRRDYQEVGVGGPSQKLCLTRSRTVPGWAGVQACRSLPRSA